MSRLVIVGSGWAGHTLAHDIDDKRSEVTVVSPDATTPYTPLLASAACGLFNFSLAEEPIRHKTKRVAYLQATVIDIDFKLKICKCRPAFASLAEHIFDLPFDIVVMAPGCTNQTFGTPGVYENGLFVKNVKDAMAVRSRLLEVVEQASLPFMTDEDQRALLHVVIVGGGPTGVEIAAEMSDLFDNDFQLLYPDLKGKFSIAIHDVAPKILAPFDQKLTEHALATFSRSGVAIKTGSHILKVEPGVIHIKEDGEIKYGILIWATGNKQVPLVDTLKVMKSDHLPRILTDAFLRPYAEDGTVIHDAYAIGDAADIKGAELPTTAEVACQKGAYLAKVLDGRTKEPFAYAQKAIVAYTGHHDGVVAGKRDYDYSGSAAWLAWRSKNLTWSGAWRNKILIAMNWSLDYVFGKEIARN